LFAELRGYARYARGLSAFLANPLGEHEARGMIADGLGARAEHLLRLIDWGVFKNPASPYLPLFERGGVELGDVAGMLRSEGVDATLSRLLDAGVSLSLAEASGKEPIRRGNWEMSIEGKDLRNPLASPHFAGRSGASRSPGRTVGVDLRDVLQTSAYVTIARRAFGLEGTDCALWFPAPPGVAGIRSALWWSKAGATVRRWFAQAVPRWTYGEVRTAALVRATVWASRWAGRPVPAPEPAPPQDAVRVARWLADQARAGSAPALRTTPSSAARVCTAADEAGMDISGTFFALGGEPFTEAKARRIELAGCRAESSYYISEVGGPIAVGCSAPAAVDAAHVAEDRVALIESERALRGGRVRALYATSLSPVAPRIAINLETGDCATRGRSTCGCPFAEQGLNRTLSEIRSYEKLTTEGMHFLGPRLHALLEEVLPERFGGAPTDYQLVEEETGQGRSQIILAVSPRVGTLDESSVARAALAFLGARGGGEGMMAEVWANGATLRVVRREPEFSSAGKVLPLHVSPG
jgi:hypothetical protein